MPESRPMQDFAIDHYTGKKITYPQPTAQLKFDFLFRKAGRGNWRYINSFNENSDLVEKQKELTVIGGGEWRVVSPQLGIIIDEGK